LAATVPAEFDPASLAAISSSESLVCSTIDSLKFLQEALFNDEKFLVSIEFGVTGDTKLKGVATWTTGEDL
jgi:hypothetical protein